MRQGWNDVWARNSTSLIWKIFYAEGNNSWKINGTALQRLPLKDYTDKRVNKQHKQEIIVAWRGGEGGGDDWKKTKTLKSSLGQNMTEWVIAISVILILSQETWCI